MGDRVDQVGIGEDLPSANGCRRLIPLAPQRRRYSRNNGTFEYIGCEHFGYSIRSSRVIPEAAKARERNDKGKSIVIENVVERK